MRYTDLFGLYNVFIISYLTSFERPGSFSPSDKNASGSRPALVGAAA